MQRSKLHGQLHFCVLSLRTTIFESQIYQMLINSNQLVGAGSVSMPENITAGVNPHKSNVFVFWNIKLMSNILVSIIGDLTMLSTPFDFLLCGTGMAVWCSEKEKIAKDDWEFTLDGRCFKKWCFFYTQKDSFRSVTNVITYLFLTMVWK